MVEITQESLVLKKRDMERFVDAANLIILSLVMGCVN